VPRHQRVWILGHSHGHPRPASLSKGPPDRLNARRWASFVGPLRAKLWRADDWVGPTGRARIRAQSQETNLRLPRSVLSMAPMTLAIDTRVVTIPYERVIPSPCRACRALLNSPSQLVALSAGIGRLSR
jgi:hypothetical protein